MFGDNKNLLLDDKLKYCLDRHANFWQFEQTDKPLIGYSRFSYFPLEDFKLRIDEGLVSPNILNCDQFVSQYEESYSHGGLYMGDLLWAASPIWGFPWLEAIIGCEIEVKKGDSSFWVKHPYHTIDDIHELKFSPDNEWFRLLIDFIEMLANNSRGRYPLATPILRGPVDMLAALVGNEQLAYAAYDRPNLVQKFGEKCAEIFVTVANAMIERFPSFWGGMSQMQHVWSPGTTVMTQQDAALFFTPSNYKKMLIPADIYIIDNFQYPMMHFHSTALHTLNDFLSIDNLRCIQIVVDQSGPTLEQLIPIFLKIQECKPLVVFADINSNQLDYLLDRLSPKGLCIYIKHAK